MWHRRGNFLGQNYLRTSLSQPQHGCVEAALMDHSLIRPVKFLIINLTDLTWTGVCVRAGRTLKGAGQGYFRTAGNTCVTVLERKLGSIHSGSAFLWAWPTGGALLPRCKCSVSLLLSQCWNLMVMERMLSEMSFFTGGLTSQCYQFKWYIQYRAVINSWFPLRRQDKKWNLIQLFITLTCSLWMQVRPEQVWVQMNFAVFGYEVLFLEFVRCALCTRVKLVKGSAFIYAWKRITYRRLYYFLGFLARYLSLRDLSLEGSLLQHTH